MPDSNGVPEIAPGQLAALGQQFQVLVDVDPAQFPNGLELIIMVPGRLEPFGKITCRPGAMLVAPPEAMAHEVRKEIQRQVARINAGEVPAPGFH